jgi:hypothetical protein
VGGWWVIIDGKFYSIDLNKRYSVFIFIVLDVFT